jgi:two-component system NtrC family sensor kinase
MNRLLFFITIIFISKFCNSQIVISDVNKIYNVDKGISYIEDKKGVLPFNSILKSNNFLPITSSVPNFGITTSTIWLKIQVKNITHNESYLFQVSQPGLDEIDLYQSDKNGIFTNHKGGECLPFSARDFFDPNYIYSIRLDTTKISELYLRIKSRDNLQIPILIGLQKKISDSNKTKDFIFGIYAGIMLVMFLYNTFLYITVRDKTYLYYIIYLATVILTQISIQGYTFQYLWPNSPIIAQWSAFVFSPLVGVSSAYFMRIFLNTAFFCPKMDKGFIYFTITYSVSIFFAFIGLFDISYLIITFCASSLSIYMMITAYFVFKKHYKPARFFIIAWSLFLFGVTIYAMTNLGVLPINNFTFYTMTFGSAAEVVLLSFALADRINILKKEKEQYQSTALAALQTNEKLIIEQNVVLENKVEERTTELKHTNEELHTTLSNLKNTQAQLVNVEKMASLGQLTAGIAHEINNPINFVSANIKPLKMDFDDVLELIKKYESITTEVNLADKLKEIESYKEQINLTYLMTEIESLISVIDDGAKRTAEIVAGLKNFSRLDESDVKTVNINEGIQSTLLLLKSAIPRDTTVITELGDIPRIECLPGKLNQVFMNLLSNAIYAINKKKTDGDNKLIIKSYELNDHICVSIEDTGIGMTDNVKAKVFEPFFTTKDVGEGTGLGMSIVFKIIESHHAKIEIESEYGVGTKIIIILNKRLDTN